MTFPLRIVTPDRVAWEGSAESLMVPSWEGSLGILPGHAPLLAQLREGMVRVKEAGEQEHFLAVAGGFVEVSGGRVSLFAEAAELAEEIDAERARQAVERAKKALKASPVEALDRRAAADLARALARLRVVGRAGRRQRHLGGGKP